MHLRADVRIVSKLPMRQKTYVITSIRKRCFSKLPMRQKTVAIRR